MAVSTARSKLYKEIVFSLAVECKKNVCLRCNKTISKSSEFTVDHKIGWRFKTNASELFFDLNNIAFSHNSCNSSFVGGRRGRQGETGVRGVAFIPTRKSPKKYKVMVHWKKKRHIIGYFENLIEAATEYNEAAKRIQGIEHAVLNDLSLLSKKSNQGRKICHDDIR